VFDQGAFLAINRQPLESCLNTHWNRQVFQFRLKKVFIFGFEISVAELKKVVVLSNFWPNLYGAACQAHNLFLTHYFRNWVEILRLLSRSLAF